MSKKSAAAGFLIAAVCSGGLFNNALQQDEAAGRLPENKIVPYFFAGSLTLAMGLMGAGLAVGLTEDNKKPGTKGPTPPSV